jgi:hypothetical protein
MSLALPTNLQAAFNAALVIYATLLVQHQATVHHQRPLLDQSKLGIDDLHLAVDCISLLYKGNRMTEKCAQYTSSLAKTLTVICK